jgi:hypothetical protein
MLLQAFHSIRSERQLMERVEFDPLFRCFVGIGVDDAAWDHSTFSKNRERLLEGDIAAKLRGAVAAAGEAVAQHGPFLGRRDAGRGLASMRVSGRRACPRAKTRGTARAIRRRQAAGGTTKRISMARSAPMRRTLRRPIRRARLYRKGPGKEAKLCFMGHALMENRNGLVVDACLTEANGHAERIAALHMIEPRADRPRPITLGADKAYAPRTSSMNCAR